MQQPACSVRLIWGLRDGKTKTISALLWSMLIENQRTVTCAPTNTAVAEVASRVLGVIEESSGGGAATKCFFGDVVLFGNEDRMAVDRKLENIFLDTRVRRLRQCLMPITGWTKSLSSMIALQEDSMVPYERYDEAIQGCVLDLVSEEIKLRNVTVVCSLRTMDDKKVKEMQKDLLEVQKKAREVEREKMSFETYFQSNYKKLAKDLRTCVETFVDDLPRSATSEENFCCMAEVLLLLDAFGVLVQSEPVEQLQALFKRHSDVRFRLREAISSCLRKLWLLSSNFKLPEMYDSRTIDLEFLLQNAKIVLCTASSSYRLLYMQKAQPLEVPVVDEAAQLKECESLIPLQLPGVRHAVLIDDEYLLPALVKSKLNSC